MTGKSNQRTWVVISIVLTAVVSPAVGRTIYVPADFNNIQAAIDDSNDGDTIIVADGTYTGDGNRDIDFLGKAITLRSENGPEYCIIDCNGTWTEYHRGFHFHSGEDANSIVDGFTITNGHAEDGGGIKCCYSSNPIISNCVIMRNKVENNGGGIYCRDSSPTLTNCTFNENWIDLGYIYPPEDLRGCGVGMCNYENSSPILSNCTFSRNMPAIGGGGIVNYLGSNPTLTNCIFNDNWAEFGGGMCNVESSPTLTNCTFSNNDADWGSGMLNLQFSNPTVTNCILWDGGDEIQNYGSKITITYSDVHGGSTGIYLDPNSTLNWEVGNIDVDPCFADANNGDYHLKSQAGRWDPNSQTWVKDDVTSPCIDAGSPGCPIGDEPVPNGNRRNMGAYGGTAEASKSPAYWRSIADITNDWIVDSNDLKVFCGYWLQKGECIPGDFDRSRSVDSNDFAIFGGQWRQKGPGPGITYEVDQCIPTEFALSAAGESEPTRFTVTVEGSNIHFEDLITANCCADEIELLMTVEAGIITIYEIEHLIGVPCPCICDYPITATLGPFEPGTYILEVYQDGYFVGTTTVTIDPAS